MTLAERLLFWLPFDYNNIETKGIVDITLDDVKAARNFGDGRIKLIGYAEFMDNGKIYSTVTPMYINRACPLSGVNDVFNAVMVTGDCVGELMFYGAGAGKLPTASAVVADVVDCIKHKDAPKKILWAKPQSDLMACEEDKSFAYFVRAIDTKENVLSVFSGAEVKDAEKEGEVMFMTKPVTASVLNEKLEKLGKTITAIKVLG